MQKQLEGSDYEVKILKKFVKNQTNQIEWEGATVNTLTCPSI